MGKLEGMVAVITGGGRGIGRAVALAYAREGAAVVVASRTRTEIDHVGAEVARHGGRALALPTDMTDEGAVHRLMEATLTAYGRCDIFVNNAGTAGPIAETADLSLAEWEAGLRANLTSTFLGCRAAIPQMRRQGSGKLINVASGLAVLPLPGVSTYSAAKAAVIQFSRALAEELRPDGIHAFALAPGVVRTAVLEGLFGPGDARTPAPIRNRINALEAKGMLTPPEQSARLFVLLAADEGNEFSGQFVRWDDIAVRTRLAAFEAAASEADQQGGGTHVLL